MNEKDTPKPDFITGIKPLEDGRTILWRNIQKENGDVEHEKFTFQNDDDIEELISELSVYITSKKCPKCDNELELRTRFEGHCHQCEITFDERCLK